MNEIQAILYGFLLEIGQEQKAEAYRAKCEEENKNAKLKNEQGQKERHPWN